MTKKIFCDGCGDEMSCTDFASQMCVKPQTVEMVGTQGGPIKMNLSIRVSFDQSTGECIDLCYDCRLHLLEKLGPYPLEDAA